MKKTNDVSFDIFVVDNASSDGSPQMIKEEFPDVKLIESNENLSFGRANNIAIRQCTLSDGMRKFISQYDKIDPKQVDFLFFSQSS